MTHASRALQSNDLSGEGISCGSHNFLTTKEHGGPRQMSDQLKAGTTSETLKTIDIIHSHIDSNKADMRRIIMMAKLYSETLWV